METIIWIAVAFMGGIFLGTFTMGRLMANEKSRWVQEQVQFFMREAADYMMDMCIRGKSDAAIRHFYEQTHGRKKNGID